MTPPPPAPTPQPGAVALAFDVGGTRLKSGLVEVGTGRVVAVGDPVASGDTWPGALEALEKAAAALTSSAGGGLVGVGLAVPGVVDRGRIVALPGKLAGVVGVDLAAAAREAAGLGEQAAVAVANDAVAAGVGEAVAGAGAGADRVVVVTIGTGVGVCVVEHGRPLGSGPFGGGTLGGQIPVGGDHAVPAPVRELTDTAGSTGTIEARCRAAAVLAHARAAGGDWGSVEEVVRAWRDGDAKAADGVASWRADLARGLAALAHAHAPTAIVVGGGPITGEPSLLDGVEAAIAERLRFGLEVSVRPAALGDLAGVAGIGVLLQDGGA